MMRALTHSNVLAVETPRALDSGMPSDLGAMGFPEMRTLSNKTVAELDKALLNVSNTYKCRDGNSAANVAHARSASKMARPNRF